MEEIHWEGFEGSTREECSVPGRDHEFPPEWVRHVFHPRRPSQSQVQAYLCLLLRAREEGTVLFKPLAKVMALCVLRSSSGPPLHPITGGWQPGCPRTCWHAVSGWILVEGGGGHGSVKKKLLPELTGSKTDPIKVFPHALAPQEVTRLDAWMQDV